MNTYYCYTLWHFIESDVVELKFENDKEAFDHWLGLYQDYQLDCCLSITRLFEVDGVFHEEFIGMIKRAQIGIQFIKSHAL